MPPKIVHTTKGQTSRRVEAITRAFLSERIIPSIRENLDFLDGKIEDPASLLELRKKLRDTVKLALAGDDRVTQMAASDSPQEIKNGVGYEPLIAILAALIDYHMDSRVKEMLAGRWC